MTKSQKSLFLQKNKTRQANEIKYFELQLNKGNIKNFKPKLGQAKLLFKLKIYPTLKFLSQYKE